MEQKEHWELWTIGESDGIEIEDARSLHGFVLTCKTASRS